MSSSKQMKDFVLEQLRLLKNIAYRPMMGEFLLYHNGILFGGIYDDRLLIKKTKTNKDYMLKEEYPYEKAKTMYIVDNLDNAEYLCELVERTCKGLTK